MNQFEIYNVEFDFQVDAFSRKIKEIIQRNDE